LGSQATWGADLHKRLAKELQSSNILAQKCLAKLSGERPLPKPAPKTRDLLAELQRECMVAFRNRQHG